MAKPRTGTVRPVWLRRLAIPIFRGALFGAVILLLVQSGGLSAQFLADGDREQADSTGNMTESRMFSVPKVESPITLDAAWPKSVWDAVEALPAVVMVPNPGSPPSERTEFRLVHDGEYLYFSCRAYDSEPALLQAASLRRDERGWSSDRCGIFLDTMNDEENSVGFITTPAGVLSDASYRNGSRPNLDWDAFWDVAVRVDEEGWHAEIRIPFSSLLFQVGENGEVVMGVSMLRGIARRNERIVHPAIIPRWGDLSHTRASEMRKVVLQGVRIRAPLLISPYILAGTRFSHLPDPGATAYRREGSSVQEVGLDLRYGLTSNLTLDVSVNTDFAQVEADDQQVNLSRFGLFFPEKRRFFQERGGLFEYSLGGQERLFHSRQVGLAQGQPVRIFGGARLVGRIGEWDLGVLNMQTAESPFLPPENQGVLRLRRRIMNPHSYVGGIVTSRIGIGGGRNVVLGLDTTLRLLENDDLTLNLAHTLDDALAGDSHTSQGMLGRSLLRANWARPGQDGLTYGVGFSRSGPAFEPRMGFLLRRDFSKVEGDLGYGWRLSEGSRFRTYGIGVDAVAFWRNQEGDLETVEIGPTATLASRAAHQLTLTVPLRFEDLAGPIVFSPGASIPPGEYLFALVRLNYRPAQGSLFQAPVTFDLGQFFDGHQTSVSLRPTWNLSRHLTLGGGYSVDRVEFPDRNETFTAHVGQVRTEVMFTGSTSTLAFLQYNSAQDAMVANVRFHYRPREGTDLYLVWNEGLVTDRGPLELARPLRDNRTLLLKYSHTFRMTI